MFKSVYQSLGIKDEVIKNAIKDTSKKLHIDEEDVLKSLEQELKERQDRCIEDSKLELKDYQKRAVSHMQLNRGLIVAFDVGSGKTLTAVSILACLRSQGRFFNKKIKFIIVTPTSLQQNFKKEMKAYGMSSNIIDECTFYTVASFSNVIRDNKLKCDKRTVLIIDEAHEFKKDYRGEFGSVHISKGDTDTRAYRAIKCAASAWKVVLLTGTPLYNAPHDIVNLVAMVKGSRTPMVFSEFMKSTQNDNALRDTYGCIFSFYTPPRTNYPNLKTDLVLIDMTTEYNKKYNEIMHRIGYKKRGKLLKSLGMNAPVETEEVKNSFMIALRKASNNLEPCQKCDYVVDIAKKGKKMIIFSEFVTSGIDIIKKKLDQHKIKYLEIKGSIPKGKREDIVKEMNKKEKGVLFITKAGGQGLDLKGIRDVVLFEVGWNESSAEQVIGRAVRYRSHDHLSPASRTVNVHRLMAITQEDRSLLNNVGNNFSKLLKRYKEVASADLYLYLYSTNKKLMTDELGQRLKNIDINSGKC